MDNQDSYTYRKYEDNKLLIQLAGLVGLLVILFLLKFTSYISNRFLIFFLIAFAIIFKIFEVSLQNLRRYNYLTWGRGAGAEWVIGKELEKLPFSYELIPDFNTGRGNIDHICIGETGIFAIEVKAERGRITNVGNQILINNKSTEKNFITQARAEMFFLRDLLKEKTGKDYPVTGMLIFPNARVDIRHPVDGIWVGDRRFCKWFVERKPAVLLSDMEIDRAIKLLDEFGDMSK